jgi:uncharacterized protein YegP (UPF0339 family)
MSKYFFKIQYNNIEIISDTDEHTDKEVEDAKDFVKKAVNGKFDNMSIKHNGNEYYFPKAVLINSIISIQKVE